MIKKIRLVTLIGALVLVLGAAFDWNPERDVHFAARFQNSGDHDQALRLARRAALTGRSDEKIRVSALLIQTRAALSMKRPGYALDRLNLALELAPDNNRARLLRGRVRLQTKDFPGALADLDKGVESVERTAGKKPTSLAPYLVYRGYANLALGRADKVAGDMEAALALNPNLPIGHWLRSRLLENDGQLRPALIAAEKAMSLAQNRDRYFFMSSQGSSWNKRLVRLRMKNKVDPIKPFTGNR